MKVVFLDNMAKLKVRQFLGLFPRLAPNSSLTLKPMDLVGENITLKIEPALKMDSEGKITLELKWRDKDKDYSQTIEIEEEKRFMKSCMNGGVSFTCYYFKQADGLRGREVYYYDGEFKNRRAFKSTYKIKSQSKTSRRVARVKKGSPEKKYGKRFCKGKLTDYGRRCVRYEIAQLEILKAMYGEITKAQEESLADLRKMLGILDKKKKN